MAIKSKVTLSYHFSTKNFIIIIPQHKLQYNKDILYDKNNIKKHLFHLFLEEKKIAAKISPVPVGCKHISNDAITAS